MTREEAIKHFEAWAQCNYAPTRDAALMALSALRPVSREQVEKVWRGEWLRDFDTGEPICGNCHHVVFPKDYVNGELPHFCEFCGEAKTDEAVQMVMKRLEALYETI